MVYEVIKDTRSHPTADWVFEAVRANLPKISLGTVYRNLSVLKEDGLVREIHGMDRRAHYDADLSPHAHFICTECGTISDVHSPLELDWRKIKELVGCEVSDQRIEFNGVCAGCRHRAQERN
jgi:Fe2+ or Zn2+ uptake regulation protein